MLSSGKRMSRMIEDMLDLARARLAGGIPLKREPADLGALVQRVVQEHQAAFPDRRIELLLEGDLTGDWDADRLAQVASNLIGNALQHGDAGEAGRASASTARAPTSCVCRSPTPARIPPELLPHLFDPFRGGQRRPGRSEGLGLGLYIVQQIVQAHQGSVDVQSGEATHTVFRVKMPRRISETVRL